MINHSTINSKEPVRLRKKLLANGSHSLYLDIYWNRKRSYEFLSLYINVSATKASRVQNKLTLSNALRIKHQRILEILSGSSKWENTGSEVSFIDYFKKLALDRSRIDQNSDNWQGALKHLIIFLGQSNIVSSSLNSESIQYTFMGGVLGVASVAIAYKYF